MVLNYVQHIFRGKIPLLPASYGPGISRKNLYPWFTLKVRVRLAHEMQLTRALHGSVLNWWLVQEHSLHTQSYLRDTRVIVTALHGSATLCYTVFIVLHASANFVVCARTYTNDHIHAAL